MTAEDVTAGIEVALQSAIVSGMCPALSLISGDFNSLQWYAYKKLFGVTWDRPGRFINAPKVEVRGGRDYVFKYDPTAEFHFARYNGEVICPKGDMITDGGTTPRVAWCIPGLDPWAYMPAFLIHDFDFLAHHCWDQYPRTFEDVNETLAEAVYTLMMDGVVPQNWAAVATIYHGCASPIGRRIWNRSWSQKECDYALPKRT